MIMKNSTFTLLLLISISVSNAQSKIDLEIGGNYLFIDSYSELKIENEKVSAYKSYKLYEPNDGKATDDTTNSPIKADYVVRIVDIDDGQVYFKYWVFEEDDDLEKNYNSGKIFSLSMEDFSRITTKRYNRWRDWSVKSFSVPIRLRGADNDFEFETNLSLGTSITTGWNYNIKRDDRFLDFSLGLGITKVNVNPHNSEKLTVGDEVQTPTAFTIAAGVVWHFSGVNAGVFFGWDKLSGLDQSRYGWIHNKKPWLGLGINIGLGNNETKNTGKAKKND